LLSDVTLRRRGASEEERLKAGPVTENPGGWQVYKLRHWPPGTDNLPFVPFFFVFFDLIRPAMSCFERPDPSSAFPPMSLARM
jgi:hypothetical protein